MNGSGRNPREREPGGGEAPRRRALELDALRQLPPLLEARGYEVIAPTLRDGAIVYDVVHSLDELPVGWTDEQAPGSYRLRPRGDGALFGYAVGPQSWKRLLHPPALRLFEARREAGQFKILDNPEPARRRAFLGVRACDLAAIRVQDRVLLGDRFIDSGYQDRRESIFVVAVNCTHAVSTCFCTSMGTGPAVDAQSGGVDLALTEVIEAGRHRFLAEAGTPAGEQVLAALESVAAPDDLCQGAAAAVQRTAQSITRRLDTTGIRDLLYDNVEHPRWDDVARRCLSCANCTMVCPTCFCTTVEDTSDLSGEHAERWRKWDSCFSLEFTHLHGGSVRNSPKSRYRHWMTHKLASWIDQFGSSGCVGCGRCIAWCPVGIDITEEVHAIRAAPLDAHAREKRDENA